MSCSSHIDVSTCSAITCRPLISSSVWHLFAIFRNNSGYRVSLCNGATNRSRIWSLRHCSFLSHHWGRGGWEWEKKRRSEGLGACRGVCQNRGETGGWVLRTKAGPDKYTSTMTAKVTRGRNGHIPLCGRTRWHWGICLPFRQRCCFVSSLLLGTALPDTLSKYTAALSRPWLTHSHTHWRFSCSRWFPHHTFTYIPKSSLGFRLSR